MYTYAIDFIAGGTALSCAFAITHPLDTLKTQLQTSQPLHFKSAFRGFAVSALGAIPQGGLRLATYEYVKSKGDGGLLSSSMAAIAGDFCSSIIKVPREIITTRMQASRTLTFSQIVKNLYAEQGLRGFFKGFVCLSMRDWPFMILLFTSYESLNHFESTVIKGGIAGAFAGFLTSPMDAIKTQLMLRKNPNDGIREIFMKMNLFKGAWMRTVWWFGVCSIFFPVYEHCKRLGSAHNVQIPIPLTSP